MRRLSRGGLAIVCAMTFSLPCQNLMAVNHHGLPDHFLAASDGVAHGTIARGVILNSSGVEAALASALLVGGTMGMIMTSPAGSQTKYSGAIFSDSNLSSIIAA